MGVEDLVHELCESLITARSKTIPAFRNLREVQPGFPSTTPGNGSVGGGSGGHGESIVERMLDEDGNMRPDDAAADLETATELIHRMKPLVRDFRDLMIRWGYTTSGEYQPGKRHQPSVHGGQPVAERDCCSHHLKFSMFEPLGAKGRGGLCRWCYDFQHAEGVLPPSSFLEHRARGGTVTTAMVAEWNKARQVESTVAKQRARRRANKRKRR